MKDLLGWWRVVLREIGGMRLVTATLDWVGLNLAAWSRLFEPLPDISVWVWLALAAVATFGAGLLAGRWMLLVLAIVPLLVASAEGFTSRSDGGAAVSVLAGVATGGLIACGVLACRIVRVRMATVVGSLLLAAPLPLVGWAALRTLWPYDARPAHPLRVNLRAGSFQDVRLGQSLADARRALPRSVATSTPPPAPLDAPSAPLGVAYYPAGARSVRGRGIGLLVVHGRVALLFITNPRAEAIAGVGVGDNLGVARDRLRGLVCADSNGGEPTCAGRSGHYTVLFVDDPIKTITLSAIDTGWCLVRSASCHRRHPATQVRPR